MSQLEKSLQSIEAGRYVITWLASRADILFFAYRCLDFVTSTHEPLERTSEVLESFLPEINLDTDKTTNDQNVVELREGRVFRSMQSSGEYVKEWKKCDLLPKEEKFPLKITQNFGKMVTSALFNLLSL